MKPMIRPIKTEHPHIERRPGVCGGSPVVRGTRIPVRLIAGFTRDGVMTPDEIAEAYPQLTLAQIHDALSYYYDHKSEIDEELRQGTLEYILKKYNWEKDEQGFLRPRRRSK